MNPAERKYVTVPMSPELHAQLLAYAKADDRTMVSVIRLAVVELLARDEDERNLRMAS